jgi:uncharacterized membrane protein HdeD (DUF308 family)
MTKKLFLSALAVLTFNLAFAEKADYFLATEDVVDMQQLDALESFVMENEGITYEEVAISRADLVAGVSATPSLSSTSRSRAPLGIPSFLWGCIFGVAGLAVVYFVADNKKETKKAFWGCVTSTVVGIVVYIVVFAAAASTAASAGI